MFIFLKKINKYKNQFGASVDILNTLKKYKDLFSWRKDQKVQKSISGQN